MTSSLPAPDQRLATCTQNGFGPYTKINRSTVSCSILIKCPSYSHPDTGEFVRMSRCLVYWMPVDECEMCYKNRESFSTIIIYSMEGPDTRIITREKYVSHDDEKNRLKIAKSQ